MNKNEGKDSPPGADEELVSRAIRFCEFQERCTSELKNKLKGWQLPDREIEHLLARLVKMGYVDDERFARNYAGSKFRVNGWGKVKIRAALRYRKINEQAIESALEQIGPDQYKEELVALLVKKRGSLLKYPVSDQKARLFRFAASRGYETGAIIEVLNRILID